VVNHGALASAVFFGQIFVFHGKAIADYVFNRGKSYLMSGFHHPATYGLALSVTVCIVLIRAWPAEFGAKAPLALLLALVGPSLIQATSTWPAMMVFFLHLYLLAVVAVIILVEEVFRQQLQKRFWSSLFDRILRTIRYILVLFTAGVAVLRYLSAGLREPSAGFLSSLFYPTAVMILSIGMIAQWLLLPAWGRMIDSFREEPRKPRATRKKAGDLSVA
jgi:hypothetical protein